jgi:hypothetical protein
MSILFRGRSLFITEAIWLLLRYPWSFDAPSERGARRRTSVREGQDGSNQDRAAEVVMREIPQPVIVPQEASTESEK